MGDGDWMNVGLCGEVVGMGRKVVLDRGDVCLGIELCEEVWGGVGGRCGVGVKGGEIMLKVCGDRENMRKDEYVGWLLGEE